ncbi:hypothetical protein LINGRAHAP2_LOCUS24620 [Linum grandiflorum]
MHSFHSSFWTHFDRHRHDSSHGNSSPSPVQPGASSSCFGYRVCHVRVLGFRRLRDGCCCYSALDVHLRGWERETAPVREG